MELNGKRVVINGMVFYYGKMVIKLLFSLKMGDCGNGCLFLDGRELVYFDGKNIKFINFLEENIMKKLLIVGIVVLSCFFVVYIIKIMFERRRKFGGNFD